MGIPDTNLFDELLQHGRRMEILLRLLKDDPSGHHMEPYVRLASGKMKYIMTLLRERGRPFRECPLCDGHGCRLCDAQGWITKFKYDTVAKELLREPE